MRKLLYILLVLCLTSCLEKEIPFEGKDSKKLLTLSATFSTDSLMTVYLSPTKSVIGIIEGVVPYTGEQASVDVYEDGIKLEALTYNDIKKAFVGSNKPIAGKTYTLKAKANGLDDVEAVVYVPEPVEIIAVSKLENINSTSDSFEDRKFSISFKDENITNYYKLNVFSISTYFEDRGNVEYRNVISFTSKDAVFKGKTDNISDSFETEYSNLFGVFTDEFIGDNEYSIELNIASYELFEFYDDFKLFVTLQSISEDYYLFLKSRELQLDSGDSPFSEPVQIWSNVRGGAGIAAAYSVSTKEVIIEK